MLPDMSPIQNQRLRLKAQASVRMKNPPDAWPLTKEQLLSHWFEISNGAE